MYRIMIVDDEYNARDGLENVIDWGQVGAEVVGNAADGEEALAKFPALAPDIVITDVKMDKMDGLEMTQRIGELYPRVKIIVLSGYDEPEYIRRSLGLKVFAYLLKPVRGKEILDTARELIGQLERESSLLRRVELMEAEFGRNKDFLLGHFLRDLLVGSIKSREQFAERAAFLQLPFSAGRYRCALLALDDPPREAGEYAFRKLRSVHVVAEGLLRGRGAGGGDVAWSGGGAGSGVAAGGCDVAGRGGAGIDGAGGGDVAWSGDIAWSGGGAEAWLVQAELDRLALIMDARMCDRRIGELVESIKALLDVSVTAAVGSDEEMFDIWRSYRQAAIVCGSGMSPGANGVIYYSDMPPTYGSSFLYPEEKERALLESANCTDDEIAAMAADLLDEMERQNCSRERMVAEVAGLLGQHARKSMDLGVDVYELFGREALDPFRLFERYGERARIHAWLTNILAKTRDEIRREKTGRAGNLVRRAAEYIAANYGRSDISLDAVAHYLRINPSYFSRVFKREAGESFIDALTELRVGKSKEMLGQSGARVADIAAAVGFQSTRYFCTLFRKNVGCSPTEYREMSRSGAAGDAADASAVGDAGASGATGVPCDAGAAGAPHAPNGPYAMYLPYAQAQGAAGISWRPAGAADAVDGAGDVGDARAPYAPRVSYALGAAAYGGAPRGRRRSAAGGKPSAFRRLADRGARK